VIEQHQYEIITEDRLPTDTYIIIKMEKVLMSSKIYKLTDKTKMRLICKN
jgi:hypothetical protein